MKTEFLDIADFYRARIGDSFVIPSLVETVPKKIDQVQDFMYPPEPMGEFVPELGKYYFLPCKLDDFWLPVEPIISINMRKLIIKTDVADLPGSVKEHIKLDDYEIAIRGILINDEIEDLPDKYIRKLRQISEKLESIPVICRLFSYFNISQIVIEHIHWPGEEGTQDSQWYEISALSDNPVELILRSKK